MYYTLSMLSGVLIAFMLVQNGVLSERYGAYGATVIIHIVGLALTGVMVAVKRRCFTPGKKLPLWLYLGGVIGVVMTVFTNMAFGKISVSAILALGLLGQSLISLVIDGFGLFGMPKRRLYTGKLFGIALVACGIIYMTPVKDIAMLLPVALALFTGFSIVVNRMLNAALAQETDPLFSVLCNYVFGLATALAAMLVFGAGVTASAPASLTGYPMWAYLGGVTGVIVVLMSNLIVSRISSFYLTIIVFVGQVFTGILLDVLLSGVFSKENLVGGIIVTVGLIQNLVLDARQK